MEVEDSGAMQLSETEVFMARCLSKLSSTLSSFVNISGSTTSSDPITPT